MFPLSVVECQEAKVDRSDTLAARSVHRRDGRETEATDEPGVRVLLAILDRDAHPRVDHSRDLSEVGCPTQDQLVE